MQRLMAREKQMPTSTPEGVAFPHALAAEIDKTHVAAALLKPGVDFGVAHHPRSDLRLLHVRPDERSVGPCPPARPAGAHRAIGDGPTGCERGERRRPLRDAARGGSISWMKRRVEHEAAHPDRAAEACWTNLSPGCSTWASPGATVIESKGQARSFVRTCRCSPAWRRSAPAHRQPGRGFPHLHLGDRTSSDVRGRHGAGSAADRHCDSRRRVLGTDPRLTREHANREYEMNAPIPLHATDGLAPLLTPRG
ncbi:MAG: PTS sugar transporter subunit IIA [Gammaproteobacteria bacterium]|nr:PTS sugar transporter subunit IIA [Gammaproteobacteria bacterium]